MVERATDGRGCFETIPASNLQAMQATPRTFANPLGDGADPYVVQWNDMYYLVRSTGRRGVDRSLIVAGEHSYFDAGE